MHLASNARTALVPILGRLGGMQPVTPRTGDPIRPQYIYVPQPDHHLEIADGHFHLSRGPRINSARPAVDVLFRTAAAQYGPRVTGVILSGGLDDGSVGLALIRRAGGVAIVQSTDDALVPSMPHHAILAANPEHILPTDRIGEMIKRTVYESLEQTPRLELTNLEIGSIGADDEPGRITGLTCPDCHGSIWVRNERGEATFNCRIGHSYTSETFFDTQDTNVENALWAGVRSLEEQATLASTMAGQALKRGDQEGHDRFERRRKIAEINASALRELLLERSDA